jgi:L-ornithine Nalpha-acyltransferase
MLLTPTKIERVSTSTSLSLYDLGDLRAGNLEVFIASQPEQVKASQELRYRVFFEEMGARPTPEIAATRRDMDKYDDVCDHLLVVEHQPDQTMRVVGTYRLLRRDAMKKVGHFYSESEYNIEPIIALPGEILEVGRSCVDPEFRNRSVMQLLWRGIGAYVAKFNVTLMFGCASFNGIDPEAHSMALSYLYHYHLAPEHLRSEALAERYVEMNRMPKEAVNPKEAFVSLPALIKGYLRLSGYIGKGAVIDEEYNTVDVGIVVKTDLVTEKYAQRYSTNKNSSEPN